MTNARYFGMLFSLTFLVATTRADDQGMSVGILSVSTSVEVPIVQPSPGELVPSLPGQVVAPLPGQMVQSLPGQVVGSLAGQMVPALSGQVVHSLPAQMTQSLPGQLIPWVTRRPLVVLVKTVSPSKK